MRQGWNEFSVVEKPRKKHRCVWCTEPILPGEKHQKFIGEFEGDFQSWRIHLDCLDPMNEDQKRNGDSYICDGPHKRGGKCEC